MQDFLLQLAQLCGRSQGNLARTPEVAVVISLNNFLGPVDDTVTAQKRSTNH